MVMCENVHSKKENREYVQPFSQDSKRPIKKLADSRLGLGWGKSKLACGNCWGFEITSGLQFLSSANTPSSAGALRICYTSLIATSTLGSIPLKTVGLQRRNQQISEPGGL